MSYDFVTTRRVIGLAIDVHRELGPGIVHKRQIGLPLVYKTVRLDCGYRKDFVVEPGLAWAFSVPLW